MFDMSMICFTKDAIILYLQMENTMGCSRDTDTSVGKLCSFILSSVSFVDSRNQGWKKCFNFWDQASLKKISVRIASKSAHS